MVKFPNGKTVHFGGKGYTDYTIHKSKPRMVSYLVRHGATDLNMSDGSLRHEQIDAKSMASHKEHWDDPYTPGFWSRWLLWSRKSMARAISVIRRKFKIKVSVHSSVHLN